ncbi:hypothetical protein [Nannocystis punicea]|uniref:AAA+ ATPase domain-containing protein n=1 Tax=Nannocystis punicea TaxID=2995304 RepID=A0ABY7H601_9BACT|nr:hypothetical protein [Nannocystis poenicansa]WAS94532.1 hypothetical protein O0S08_00080 [Nannocystis poenicansa]
MKEAQAGDLVLHSVDRELAGFSFVDIPCQERHDEPPQAGKWANQAAYYWIGLKGYTPFSRSIPLREFLDTNQASISEDMSSTAFRYYPFVKMGDNKLHLRQGGYLSHCSPRIYDLIRDAVTGEAEHPAIDACESIAARSGSSDRDDAESPRKDESPDPHRTSPLLRPRHPVEITQAEFVAMARQLAEEFCLSVPADVLPAVHLAAITRPVVLLAGPPGLGKTTLASFYAGLLGCDADDETLLWLAIQAHWISDEAMLDAHSGLLPRLCARGNACPDLLQVALFDEFNLTRPEYYLSRYFSALDSKIPLDRHRNEPLRLPVDALGRSRLLTFATLNIDESSRPPSDKIIDRAFLIEPAELLRTRQVRYPLLLPPTHRISSQTWSRWSDIPSSLEVPEELGGVLNIFDNYALTNPSIIHESLSPSRRAIIDICAYMYHHHQIGEDHLGGMTRAHALDRAIAGRILPRLRGEVVQLRRLLDPLAEMFERQCWPRSLRHIKAMQNRVEFGFVSFWG